MRPSGGSRPTASAIWATATLFVTIVSCCSLIGVSIMPLISGPSYKIFITLFTGLAVGSLVGSAIFSLIPQAFNLHLQNDRSYLWKSLVIFFGIYLFYCSERILRIYFERRTRNKDKKKRQKNEQLKNNDNTVTVHDQSNNKLNDIEVGTSSSQNNHNSEQPLMPSTDELTRHHGDDEKTPISSVKRKIVGHEDGDNLAMTPLNQDNHTSASNLNKQNSEIEVSKQNEANEDDRAMVKLDKIHQHAGHHHALLNPHEIILEGIKGNNSAVKKEIAPVAWMIIIGDGLHNFIDGLSIGAAFSESIYFGISTSVAVICEEFPHELGDFAVLISAGMTVKQALGFNFLSACTCYIGMVFGILLGDMTQSASYIFALAGGMFLYISLVDMMGELSATLDEPNQPTRETMKLLLMQNIGILTGIIIIFSLSWIDV